MAERDNGTQAELPFKPEPNVREYAKDSEEHGEHTISE